VQFKNVGLNFAGVHNAAYCFSIPLLFGAIRRMLWPAKHRAAMRADCGAGILDRAYLVEYGWLWPGLAAASQPRLTRSPTEQHLREVLSRSKTWQTPDSGALPPKLVNVVNIVNIYSIWVNASSRTFPHRAGRRGRLPFRTRVCVIVRARRGYSLPSVR